MMIPT